VQFHEAEDCPFPHFERDAALGFEFPHQFAENGQGLHDSALFVLLLLDVGAEIVRGVGTVLLVLYELPYPQEN
jgi:hypothetical protein